MFAIYLGFDSMNDLLTKQGIADEMPASTIEIEQPAPPLRPKRYRHLLLAFTVAIAATWMFATYVPVVTLADQQPYIFIKNEHGIAVVDLDAGTTHQLIETKIVIGLDFDPESRMLYWANADDNYKCLSCVRLAPDWKNIELESLNTRLTERMEYPAGIALDRETRRIYCADYGSSSIRVFDYTGNLLSKSLTGSMEGKPSSVELDPENRVLYWTDVVNHKIGRIFLENGEQEPNFITSSGRWPDGLSIDIDRRRLFWACNKSGEVAWANLDDEYPAPNFTTLLPRPSAVEVDPAHQVLYHCDWNGSVIRRIKIDENGLLPDYFKSGALWTGGASPGVMKLFFRQVAIGEKLFF